MANKLRKYIKINPDPKTRNQVNGFVKEVLDEIQEKVWNESNEICDNFLSKAGQDLEPGRNERLDDKLIEQTSKLAEEFIYKSLKKSL